MRERAEKNFVIQTVYPESELLGITTKIALLQFYRKEQHERQLYRYPPTHTVIKISTVVPKEHEEKTHSYLLKEFTPWGPDIFSKPYTKKKDFLRIVTVLRLSHTLWNFQTLGDPSLREKINRIRQISTVEVNPEDLF